MYKFKYVNLHFLGKTKMFVVDNHFDVCLPSVCKYFAENFCTCGLMSLRYWLIFSIFLVIFILLG